jgi:hypothetical protein
MVETLPRDLSRKIFDKTSITLFRISNRQLQKKIGKLKEMNQKEKVEVINSKP